MHFLFATPAQSLCVKCLLESILQHRRILFEKLFFYKRIELFVAPTPASSPSALAGERPSRNSLSSRVIHQLWFRKKNNIQALEIVGAGEWSFETCNEFPPFPFKILRIHSTRISNCFVALLFFKEKKVVTGHWLIALPIQQSLQVVIISDDVETCFHFNCAQLLSRTVKTTEEKLISTAFGKLRLIAVLVVKAWESGGVRTLLLFLHSVNLLYCAIIFGEKGRVAIRPPPPKKPDTIVLTGTTFLTMSR